MYMIPSLQISYNFLWFRQQSQSTLTYIIYKFYIFYSWQVIIEIELSDRRKMQIGKSHFIAILTFALQYCSNALAESLIFTTTSVIGAENFTYVKISRQGAYRVELETHSGDADLYASDKTLSPTYLDYELQSVTCGTDVIHISEEYRRPVGIGVYGHPSYDQSTFTLLVFKLDGSSEYEDEPSTKQGKHGGSNFRHSEDEEESLVWTIFIGILKILVDILTWWKM